MDQQETRHLATDLRTVVTRLTKKLRKKSVTGAKLSLTARSVIAQLDQNGTMLPTELAAAEKITTQSMSQLLAQLLEMGIINRALSTEDKRKVLISLTDYGKELIEQVRHEREEWLLKAMEQVCTPDDLQLIEKAIGPLSKLVDFDPS